MKMIRYLPLLYLLYAASVSAALSSLADHPSPYIAMHADDPTAWRLWQRDERLGEAQRSGKLIFLSSGYFACHWCHVMQRESFQNQEIADYFNRHFIPVKIDRELQPVLDGYLIDFVERTRGHAGWPLNVFITPEGYPLLGFVYQPPEDLLALAKRLQRRWQGEERRQLTALAKEAAVESSKVERARVPPRLEQRLSEAYRDAFWAEADEFLGGFGQQSKFPDVPQLQAALSLEPTARLDEFLQLTLDEMASGGLRDHLGGGFFRYTIDPQWRQPHFEKMLYDNAQMARLYLQAAERYGNDHYLNIARETLNFMLQRMREGALFISSLSAVDGEGVEGGFYLWRRDELTRLFSGDQFDKVAAFWGMEGAAPFESGHLPISGQSSESETLVAEWRQKLLTQRQQRTLPIDDKQLSGWNGLALSALAKSVTMGMEEFHLAAVEVAESLMARVADTGKLSRQGSGQPGLLEDYAYVACGLLDWAEAGGGGESRKMSGLVLERAFNTFLQPNGVWLLQPKPPLPLSGEVVLAAEGPLHSPVTELLRCAARIGNNDFPQDVAVSAIRRQGGRLLEQPFSYPGYVRLLLEQY